jgi:dipeptidase D
MSVFEGLEPTALWRYFELLCNVPRCSGNEAGIREALIAKAKENGLPTQVDAVGNLVITIPARQGDEHLPAIALQGHLDMVCEKNRDSTHDFEKDPIAVERDGEWLVAKRTTLGADNGIAVAAAMAMIDDPPEHHGPIELLFTIDEERGLTGAANLDPNMLTAKTLLNLDSEEEGTVTVGCAGGGDAVIELPIRKQSVPADHQPYTLTVDGLTGGHSGLDIHHHRGNALRALGRALSALSTACGDVLISSIEGGSKRNAIPREAVAEVWIATAKAGRIEGVLSDLRAALLAEYSVTDPSLAVKTAAVAAPKDACFDAETSAKVAQLLVAIPSGVVAMNRDIAGLVDSSTNLGVVSQTDSSVRFLSCSRSAVGPALEAVREQLAAIGRLAGAKLKMEPSYPGWAPDLGSRALAVFQGVHESLFGKPAEVAALHAGLECGILGQRCGGELDMISFGPTMHGVHAPGERLNIESSGRFYQLLKATISALAMDGA